MLSGKRIILGVTGGIAAYKAAFLLREFQKADAEVRVTMTPAATRFVGIETFASLSKHDVAVNIFPEDGAQTNTWTRHVDWSEWADLFVVAPCTANTLAKIANGISDNMLTATVVAARCPLVICPTMDGEMIESPSVQTNLKKIYSFGYHVVEPTEGYLASGLTGRGRLPEPESILQRCSEILKPHGALTGKKVVVTAGPTREHLDPVRFISNPSSGKMGIAMARAAQQLGGDVTLLHGPLSIPIPATMTTHSFESAADLFTLINQHDDADVVIMAAAVADFTPANPQNHKIKKNKSLDCIDLKPTTDILARLGQQRRDDQTIIGFAMETDNLLENAAAKRSHKNMDWIIANSLAETGSGFASDTNRVHLLGKEQQKKYEGTKINIAEQILTELFPSTK